MKTTHIDTFFCMWFLPYGENVNFGILSKLAFHSMMKKTSLTRTFVHAGWYLKKLTKIESKLQLFEKLKVNKSEIGKTSNFKTINSKIIEWKFQATRTQMFLLLKFIGLLTQNTYKIKYKVQNNYKLQDFSTLNFNFNLKGNVAPNSPPRPRSSQI